MSTVSRLIGSTVFVLTPESKVRHEKAIAEVQKFLTRLENLEINSFEISYIVPEQGPIGGLALDPLVFSQCSHAKIVERSIANGMNYETVQNDPDGDYGFAGLGTHEVAIGTHYDHVWQCTQCLRSAKDRSGMNEELARHIINGGRVEETRKLEKR